MAISELRLIKNSLEYLPIEEMARIPRRTRGVYVLYKQRGYKNDPHHHYDVVYVGMAKAGQTSGARGRINSHAKKKAGDWTHFSVFEVWDNIHDNEVEELEGLFRHLYRFDKRANSLNVQKGYRKLARLTKRTQQEWT